MNKSSLTFTCIWAHAPDVQVDSRCTNNIGDPVRANKEKFGVSSLYGAGAGPLTECQAVDWAGIKRIANLAQESSSKLKGG
eukprot:8158292-Pyramimonas_sp.AAC.1